MARRKSKAKQEEELFQGLAGLAMLGGTAGTYSLTTSWKASIGVGFLGVIGVVTLMISIQRKRMKRLKRSGIAEIDQMDGFRFEQYLAHLFRSQGYKAEVTKAVGDFGADLILTKEGMRIAVQAKRYSKNVGIKAVQEAQSSIAHYRADEAWVVSNSEYTAAAYELAKSNKVRLFNREALIEMMLAMNDQKANDFQAADPKISPIKNVCPRCASDLVERSGPKGVFYGCSSFPKCRHTAPLK
ncbi:restriction endonuclease [Paenibacillus silvae]|uniref:restriction endonuclease n=1 Tax=Paenibacillus silvae TaxID=1325358 RepID=UPI0011A44794|nr:MULTISPECIES: restriction endonuclease [Paenibacillus]MCK6077402.1 restriction endonuclease [Paenibacillus silvae]MCK6151484.1 restriction endonuclease [Paenibacillus silvae]MCK6270087.1 restriction endonuclease [Paenibacillus silvae]